MFFQRAAPLAAGLLLPLLAVGSALAHGVAAGDQGYIEQTTGSQIGAFLYLGAKHMVTGYDHLLFLFGVIFFLYKLKEVAAYVTLFAIGHSTTLIAGVLIGTNVSAYLVDAIIGLSVVYKALDNLGGFRRWFGVQPNTKAAVLVFGFFHGFGLATKLQDFSLSPDGLVANLIAFNVGVEMGQLLALAAILIAMGYWRRTPSFMRLVPLLSSKARQPMSQLRSRPITFRSIVMRCSQKAFDRIITACPWPSGKRTGLLCDGQPPLGRRSFSSVPIRLHIR